VSGPPVIVVGGGVAGLGVALGLGRAGQRVIVLDRDELTVADGPDTAFAVERRGAPQVRHTHGLLARLTATLRDRFPDVLATLVAAGGVEIDLADRFADRRDGDADLRVLLARRSTLEWALRTAVAAEPAVTRRGGVTMAGLVGDSTTVRGVRLVSGERLEAQLVVAAGGRRAAVPAWLGDLGIDVGEESHDTGIVYLTRWYRTGADWDPVIDGEDLVKLAGDLGYLFYLAVPADRGTFSLTMAIGSRDSRLRSHLLDPDAFDRAAAALPLPPGLVAHLIPDGPVHPMGGLVNRIRRFMTDDGQPRVTGFHAVGDAHTCTNPIYGRGCSLALVQAVALTDAFAAHPHDPVARAIAYEAACGEQTEPWYRISVQTDRARMARMARDAAGRPTVSDDGGVGPIDQLMQLGGDDPLLGRAILKAVNLLATPQQLMQDPVLLARVMELAAAKANAAPAAARPNRWARQGPTRQELLDLTAA
jgi:2-polyprenyl-6-methoxyphenol hydroxylase-like FAD-dependent oxidoreductase